MPKSKDQCIKCGGRRMVWQYHPKSFIPGIATMFGGPGIPAIDLPEKMIKTCVRCGYTWEVPLLDKR